MIADDVRTIEEIHSDIDRRYWTDKCAQWWHPDRIEWIRCQKPFGHEDGHRGSGFEWAIQCQATVEDARRFMNFYRRIPNNPTGIVLRDDGVVEMALSVMHQAVCFIGVVGGDD